MEKKIKKLLKDIFLDAYLVSNYSKADVFVDYSGHVDSLSVHSYKDGWKADTERDFESTVYLSLNDKNSVLKSLKEIHKEINKYKK